MTESFSDALILFKRFRIHQLLNDAMSAAHVDVVILGSVLFNFFFFVTPGPNAIRLFTSVIY